MKKTAAGAALEQPIGLLHATAMVAGIIVGAAIFVQPSEVNRHVGTVAGILSVWTIAGILTLFGALVCAELSAALPRTGGVYVFLSETLSPAAGFLWAWAMFWSMHSGIIAASAVIFSRYLAVFIPLGDGGIRAAAIGIILILSAVNYVGVRQGSLLQTTVTTAKFLAIAALLGLAFLYRARVVPTLTSAAMPASSFGGFVQAVAAALFAFGGWHMVTYTAGETRRPERTIPRALMIGIALVTTCYVAVNGAYLRLLPLNRVIQIDSCGRGRGSGAGRRCGPDGGFGAGYSILARRFEWRDPFRPQDLLRGGAGGTCFPATRRFASTVPYSVCGDRVTGRVVVHPGPDRNVSRPVHSRDLYGVVVFRPAGARAAAFTAPAIVSSAAESLALSGRPDPAYCGIGHGRSGSNGRGPKTSIMGNVVSGSRSAGLHDPSSTQTCQSLISTIITIHRCI